ncbi:hypothetical protein PVK06_033982 [Gossypium arboreum]|uniref:Uncharacterized protein n=1 Tax=Gossypium arboreum TaxID=29729 RepID=A0ABR0NF24_GOSAR|nr:hypothetical protein PVK06_033982 [Gossypium arboreum]
MNVVAKYLQSLYLEHWNFIPNYVGLSDHKWQIPSRSPRMVPILRPELEKPISSPTVSIPLGEYDTIVVRSSRD